jgi:hypothetical protein
MPGDDQHPVPAITSRSIDSMIDFAQLQKALGGHRRGPRCVRAWRRGSPPT